jgi:hypothetical protein
MGSQKPILSAAKPDLVAVILERSVAQQLALALAWALGSTGGGKTQTKGKLYTGVFHAAGGGAEDVGTPKMAAEAEPPAKGAKKGAKKPSKKKGAKKSAGK